MSSRDEQDANRRTAKKWLEYLKEFDIKNPKLLRSKKRMAEPLTIESNHLWRPKTPEPPSRQVGNMPGLWETRRQDENFSQHPSPEVKDPRWWPGRQELIDLYEADKKKDPKKMEDFECGRIPF